MQVTCSNTDRHGNGVHALRSECINPISAAVDDPDALRVGERILMTNSLTRPQVEAAVRESLGDLSLGHIEVYRNVVNVYVANQFGERVTMVRLNRCSAPPEAEGAFLALEILLAPAVANAIIEQVEDVDQYADYLLSLLPPEKEK